MKKIMQLIRKKTKVYSIDYGAGEIINVLKLHDGIKDYIEVQFESGEVKVFPLQFKGDLRLITKPSELTIKLESLNTKINQKDALKAHKSYRRIGVDVNLELLVNIISNLSVKVDLGPIDKKLLSRCMNSLILEVGHVYGVNSMRAKGIVSDYMRVA